MLNLNDITHSYDRPANYIWDTFSMFLIEIRTKWRMRKRNRTTFWNSRIACIRQRWTEIQLQFIEKRLNQKQIWQNWVRRMNWQHLAFILKNNWNSQISGPLKTYIALALVLVSEWRFEKLTSERVDDRTTISGHIFKSIYMKPFSWT